jgi:His-Xaa-Ser system radical SAM maturase HxsC
MPLTLSGRRLQPLSTVSERPFLGRLRDGTEGRLDPATDVLLVRGAPEVLPDGFRAYLLHEPARVDDRADVYVLPSELRYLAPEDVVGIDPQRRTLRALYRRGSESNSLLVTERCDNYCLMCSQPPKSADDSWIVDELLEVIPLISPETREIGITGGEPALLGDRLTSLLDVMKRALPRTAVHVLTNGRRFSDTDFARAVARIGHHDLVLGIPLYSDLPEEHDYVVQARGAFDETVRGIRNLKRAGVRVELRFVVHRETYLRMPELAEFIVRNLVFVDHVALMGLELTGFAKTNLELLWVDPLDYQSQLGTAVRRLAQAGLSVSIYNLPLCVLPPELRTFARKSISDWKNTYFDECAACEVQDACAGFFASSAMRRSRGIVPLRRTEAGS